MTERRDAPRIEIKFPVTYRDESDDNSQPDENNTAMLTNLSKTGIRLNTSVPIKHRNIRISGTDDFSRLTITGEVVHSCRNTSPMTEKFGGYESGIRFTDTQEKTLEFITIVVKKEGKASKTIRKPKTDNGTPDQEETLNSTLNPDISYEPEKNEHTMAVSRNPVTETVHAIPCDGTSVSDRKVNASIQNRFSIERTTLVISALILLSAAIVILPTPLKNHARFLKEIHIQWPFLRSSEETTNWQSHMNELALTENLATCYFLRNINSEPVLVIKGRIPELPQFAEGDPKITGRLINKAGAILKERVVCAETTLSDDQLSSCQSQEIENRLKRQTHLRGQQQTHHNKIPYMVVFTDLPENIENLRAEIVISPIP